MSAKIKNITFLIGLVCLLALPAASADRTNIRPAWNLFTTQQDTEIGRTLADEAERTLVLVNETHANTYIDALGKQLAAHAPGVKYPYQFKIVDEDNSNLYDLPGGFIYISRGVIDAAQSEPQLAGVLAHGLAHVVLRHGTAAISQDYADQVPSASRGRVSVNDVMSRLNLHFDSSSSAFNHTREDERQADVVATQIMMDTGFDPRQMTRMFENFSDRNHPDAGNRATTVRAELQKMGGLPRNIRGDSPDFHSVRERYLASNGTYRNNWPDRSTTDSRPDAPSSRMIAYSARAIEFRYPDNWRVSEDSDSITLAPDNGNVSGSLAFGMTISRFEPQNRYFGRNSFSTGPAASTNLSRATDELVDHLRQSNPNMTVVRTDQRRRVDGQQAMALELTNDSPLGGRETDWLVTVLRPDGSLRYFVGVAPEREFSRYQRTFEDVVASVKFTD